MVLGFVCLFWPHHVTCGILLPQPGIELTPPAEEEWSLNYWTAREVLIFITSFKNYAVKRREAKSKGEKESYKHLNAEFQRIARRDKKAFLSNQCKEIEENNRIGKTSDPFKKIRDTKGTFHAKMGTIKDRNGMDLTEAKILRRGGKNTQKNYTKKIFMTQIITMRARHPGVWRQVGLWNHHYEQS